MSLDLQVKLLRVLETGRFMRVGSTQSQEADVRVIAATNRQPEQAVASGKLREDLLYRLNVFPIHLPPLRERLSDVPLLAEHFLNAIGAQEGRPKRLSAAALQQLQRHHWPGNVRELRNAVQRAYVMATGDVIDDDWLPVTASPTPSVAVPSDAGARTTALPSEPSITLPIGISMVQAERALILATLERFEHHKERTAAVLGISLKTLYNRLKEYQAEDPHFSAK
jgi:two-component system response regulator AtoC